MGLSPLQRRVDAVDVFLVDAVLDAPGDTVGQQDIGQHQHQRPAPDARKRHAQRLRPGEHCLRGGEQQPRRKQEQQRRLRAARAGELHALAPRRLGGDALIRAAQRERQQQHRNQQERLL